MERTWWLVHPPIIGGLNEPPRHPSFAKEGNVSHQPFGGPNDEI
jgi:hypothetical protein